MTHQSHPSPKDRPAFNEGPSQIARPLEVCTDPRTDALLALVRLLGRQAARAALYSAPEETVGSLQFGVPKDDHS